MLSQVFRLLKSLTSGKIKGTNMSAIFLSTKFLKGGIWKTVKMMRFTDVNMILKFMVQTDCLTARFANVSGKNVIVDWNVMGESL